MNISFFQSLPNKGDPHTASGTITIEEFLHKIKYGEWKTLIEKVRTEEDETKRKALKRSLPSVTISGTFISRKASELITHSGFICVDIDHYTDKKRLLEDMYTYALFKSSSGGGIAILVKIDGNKHKESFKWLQEHYFSTYGIVIDPAPSNVASLRYVSYDNELFVNEQAKTAKAKMRKEKKVYALPVILSNDEVATCINEVVRQGIDIAPDYDTYVRLAFAIVDGFGEGGRQYFHTLCSVSPKYDSRAAERQYGFALNGGSGIGVGTFYYFLKQAGIKIPKGNKKAVQLATIAKKSERSKEGIVEQLVSLEGVERHLAEKLVTEVYSRDDMDLEGLAKNPSELVPSLTEWVGQTNPVRMNILTGRLEDAEGPVTQQKINSLYLKALVFFNTKEVNMRLIESILFSDMVPQFHPIEEFIEKNKWRKSEGNIDKIIKSVRSPVDMKEVFMRKWLIGLIAAHNGYPVRSVLVFVGGQGTGKTEWFRRLLPKELVAYYAESKLDNGKDDELLMCQKLVIMDDEFGGKSKYDSKKFKEITSKSVFSLRAPYARVNEDYKRLAVLCGTSNDLEVINDPTGNTRILPIEVESIDHELFNSVDKDELFMELYRCFEAGEAWQLDKDELEYLRIIGDDYEECRSEQELILEFLRVPHEFEEGEFLTATMIKNYLEEQTEQKIYHKKLGIELRKIFGNPERKNFQRKFHVKKIKDLL